MVLDVSTDSPALLDFLTDLPGERGVAKVAEITLPAVTTRHLRTVTLPLSTRGRLVKVRLRPLGQMVLYGGQIELRLWGQPQSDWQWVPLPVRQTPEGWLQIPLPIRPTPNDWRQVSLPIRPTASDWQRVSLPVRATTTEWNKVALPIRATGEWGKVPLPIKAPSPDWQRVPLPIRPTSETPVRVPLAIPATPEEMTCLDIPVEE